MIVRVRIRDDNTLTDWGNVHICTISRSLFTCSSDRRLHCTFSSFIKHIHFMLVRLILRKKIANTVFFNAHNVQTIAGKAHQCTDV